MADRCRRPGGCRRLHLLRAGARSAGPRYAPADRRAAEPSELYGDALRSRTRTGRGESIWISADGLDARVRFAARRPSGRRGDRAGLVGDADSRGQPTSRRPRARLGGPRPVRRWESSANVFLVDAGKRKVYRPLVRAPDSDYCLCTPIWLSQLNLRIGITTLLQVAFPELPGSLHTVDVDIPTVPQFWRVPVTPVGQVPVANRPTDLTRPAEVRPQTTRSDMFRVATRASRCFEYASIGSSRAAASPRWSGRSSRSPAGTGGGSIVPTVRQPDAATVTAYNPVAASGPVLRVDGDGTVLHTRVMTTRSPRARRVSACATDLRSWAAVLQRPDKVATVVTNFPPLPRGTQQVAVVFDGLDPLNVTITPAPDATLNAADPVPTNPTFWRLRRNNPRSGWTTDWPTPCRPEPSSSSTPPPSTSWFAERGGAGGLTEGPAWLSGYVRPAPSRNVRNSGPAVREPDSPSCTNTATARSPLP